MWYNIDSTNTMLVCRRKGGQNVTDRQDYRFILQIEPGRYASRGKREHTEPREHLSRGISPKSEIPEKLEVSEAVIISYSLLDYNLL